MSWLPRARLLPTMGTAAAVAWGCCCRCCCRSCYSMCAAAIRDAAVRAPASSVAHTVHALATPLSGLQGQDHSWRAAGRHVPGGCGLQRPACGLHRSGLPGHCECPCRHHPAQRPVPALHVRAAAWLAGASCTRARLHSLAALRCPCPHAFQQHACGAAVAENLRQHAGLPHWPRTNPSAVTLPSFPCHICRPAGPSPSSRPRR